MADEHQRRVAHRAGHRPGAGHRGERARRPLRHAAVGRLQPDQPAPRRGDADRAAGVGADMQRPEPRRAGRARAGGRAAGGVVRVPRVAGDAVQRAVAGRLPAELGRRGLADDHRAGRLQPRPRSARPPPPASALGGPAAAPGREAGQIDKVLHRARARRRAGPMRPAGAPARRRSRPPPAARRDSSPRRRSARVQPRHPLGHRLQHLDRGEVAAGVGAEHVLGGQQGGGRWRTWVSSRRGRTGAAWPPADRTEETRTDEASHGEPWQWPESDLARDGRPRPRRPKPRSRRPGPTARAAPWRSASTPITRRSRCATPTKARCASARASTATARACRASAALLERESIPATFFYPAVSALLHPDEVRGDRRRTGTKSASIRGSTRPTPRCRSRPSAT